MYMLGYVASNESIVPNNNLGIIRKAAIQIIVPVHLHTLQGVVVGWRVP
jgi:hypothetical protein